ncbi:MAG: 2-iminoacetate synthase ThiH [bacterium]
MKHDAPRAAVPEWIDPGPWLESARKAGAADVWRALDAATLDESGFAALLSPAAGVLLEELAQRARERTRAHFGRTISLYVPLYLSDYCSGGCTYCGFASDRGQARHRLEPDEMQREFRAIQAMGFEEILLLTGERTPEADYAYVREAVSEAAKHFAAVTVEAFPMTVDEYRGLADAGCVGVTIYQETYDPVQYERLHRWGPKRDYAQRLDTPARVMEGGIRFAGLGALLGLADPMVEALSLYRHAKQLRRSFWKSGVTISFPRVCPQEGGYVPPYPVSDRFLAQIIFAFRLAMPDVPLTLSTRERAEFRDGIAGVGISRMSIASRTTVGGYRTHDASPDGQFHVSDDRDVATFCAALEARGLEPVFKNWDKVFR